MKKTIMYLIAIALVIILGIAVAKNMLKENEVEPKNIVDVNKENMFACSNGIVIKSPDISRIRNHIQQLDREISQDKIRFKDSSQYSNNFLYKLEKRRQLHQRISDIRRNTAYNGALEIIRCNPEAIILEDLDIKAIMSHNYIASVLQDYPLGIVQDILVNQAIKYDIPIKIASAISSSLSLLVLFLYTKFNSNNLFTSLTALSFNVYLSFCCIFENVLFLSFLQFGQMTSLSAELSKNLVPHLLHVYCEIRSPQFFLHSVG